MQFSEKPEREIIEALHEARFHYSGGSWGGYVANLPAAVVEMAAEAQAEPEPEEADPAVYACPDGAACTDPECMTENARRAEPGHQAGAAVEVEFPEGWEGGYRVEGIRAAEDRPYRVDVVKPGRRVDGAAPEHVRPESGTPTGRTFKWDGLTFPEVY